MAISLAELLTTEFEEEKRPGRKRAPLPNPPQGEGIVDGPVRNPLAVMETVLASTGPTQTMLAIAVIRLDGDTQPRGGLNEERVIEYGQTLDEGEELPSVDVVFDGVDYWLWDGFHRIEGSKRKGRIEIAVTITRGTLADAQWLSYSANKKHGLNRTAEDKARAVQRALRHPKGVTKSNREIARHCGVDEKTVRKYREKMESVAEIPQHNKRIGGDGKEYGLRNNMWHKKEILQQKNTGAEIPHLQNRKVDNRPSRYTLPPPPPAPPMDGEGYALVSWLVGQVRISGLAVAALRGLAADPAWEVAEAAKPILALIGKVDFRDEDLMTAITQVLAEEQQEQTGGRPALADPPLRPSRYETPSRYTIPQTNNYAPVFLLEQRVKNGVKALGLVMADNPGRDLRTLMKIVGWQGTDLGKSIITQLAGLEWRVADVVEAINNVASQYEQATKSQQPDPQAFKQETLTSAEAVRLSEDEQAAALVGELEFWGKAVVHLPLIVSLTKEIPAAMALRVAIDKVIAVYQETLKGVATNGNV